MKKKIGYFLLCMVAFFVMYAAQVMAITAVVKTVALKSVAIAMKGMYEENSFDYDAIRNMDFDFFYNADFMIVMQIVAQIAVIIVFAIWFYMYKKNLNGRRIECAFSAKTIEVITIGAVGLQLLFSGVVNMIYGFMHVVDEGFEMVGELINNANLFLCIVSVVILAPLMEELVCRGVMLKYLRQAFPFWAANLIQAVIFGIIHGNFVQFSYATLLGLVLGYVVRKFDSIYAAILLHACFNGVSLLISAVFSDKIVEKTIVYPIFLIIGIGVTYSAYMNVEKARSTLKCIEITEESSYKEETESDEEDNSGIL